METDLIGLFPIVSMDQGPMYFLIKCLAQSISILASLCEILEERESFSVTYFKIGT